MWRNFFERANPCYVVVAISFLFSLWCAKNFFINPDGILYIDIAKELHLNMMQVFHPKELPLPFYSLFIDLAYRFMPFSWVNSALFVNSLFFALLIVGFIQIIKALGGNKNLCWLAAFIILLHPELNNYRSYIIRDVGFWALLYWNIFALIKFHQTNKISYVLLWYAVALSAALLRVEGIVLAILGPFILLCLPHLSLKQRLKRAFFFYGFELIIGFGALIISLVSKNSIGILVKLSDLFLHWSQFFLNDFITVWQNNITQLSSILPVFFHRDYVGIFYIGGLLSYFFTRIFFMLAPPHALLFIYGLRTRCFPEGFTSSWVIISYIGAVTLLIPLLFLIKTGFVSGRYIFPVCLIALLVTPFALNYLYQKHLVKFMHKYPRSGFLLVILVIIALFLRGLVNFGYSHAYVKDAGQWIDTHTPRTATFYTNSVQLSFYANRPGIAWDEVATAQPAVEVLANLRWQQYDYIGLALRGRNQPLHDKVLASLPMKPIAKFSNKRGDTVYLFKNR
jgi:hypothetical protein